MCIWEHVGGSGLREDKWRGVVHQAMRYKFEGLMSCRSCSRNTSEDLALHVYLEAHSFITIRSMIRNSPVPLQGKQFLVVVEITMDSTTTALVNRHNAALYNASTCFSPLCIEIEL